MNLDSWSNFIGVVGVPTFLCVCLFIYFAKRDKAQSDKLDKMRETVDNNTRAMNELKQSQEQSNREIVAVISELLKYLQRSERKNE